MPPADRSNDVYEALLARIISWDLAPGAILSEVDLAAQMSVSRTPIRQALARLRRDGLVHQDPGHSASVTAVSAESAVELYQAREALEPYALMLAARSADRGRFSEYADAFRRLGDGDDIDGSDLYALSSDFDGAVRAACRNAYVGRLLEELSVHTARLRNLSRGDRVRLGTSVVQRAEVAAAVARGDGPEAARLDSLRLADSLAVVLRELVGGTQNPPRTKPLGLPPTVRDPAR